MDCVASIVTFGPVGRGQGPPILLAMDTGGVASSEIMLVALSKAQCYELLAGDSFGRVVFTRRALPAVVPVNYALQGRDILLRTDPDSQLGRTLDGTIVAFEVDAIDREARTGWSVVVVGTARMAGDCGENHAAGAPDLDTWVPWGRTTLVRIVPGEVTGRRLVAGHGLTR